MSFEKILNCKFCKRPFTERYLDEKDCCIHCEKERTKICEICGKEFKIYSLKQKPRRICYDRKCKIKRNDWYCDVKEIKGICKVCGKEFTVKSKYSIGNRKTCSSKCSSKLPYVFGKYAGKEFDPPEPIKNNHRKCIFPISENEICGKPVAKNCWCFCIDHLSKANRMEQIDGELYEQAKKNQNSGTKNRYI